MLCSFTYIYLLYLVTYLASKLNIKTSHTCKIYSLGSVACRHWRMLEPTLTPQAGEMVPGPSRGHITAEAQAGQGASEISAGRLASQHRLWCGAWRPGAWSNWLGGGSCTLPTSLRLVRVSGEHGGL